MTLKNISDTNVKIALINSTGDFYQSHNCPATLSPNASCTLKVTFTPSAPGTRAGSVKISDNATGSPQSVPLKGTASGTGSIKLTLSPPALDFGSVPVGVTSQPQKVTVTNMGNVAASFLPPWGFDQEGKDCSDFHNTPQCGTSLAPNASCEVMVTFKPKASGTRSGAFVIRQGVRTVSIPLSGTGTP